MHESTVPICWNYEKEDYPIDFLRRFHHLDQSEIDTGDFWPMLGVYTQESILDEEYDSDGALVDHQGMQPPAFGANIAHLSMKPMCNVSDAQILGKLKTMLSSLYYHLQADKNELYYILKMEEDIIICSSLTRNKLLTAIVTNSESMVSLHLPLDTTKQSMQHAYPSHNSRKKW
jgi:hypothetical protein